ncbi:hypothetical protein [Luteolibacter sp. AS25]|uniref:hypothetical protein n=1 Tax=Luteolibacter sp. AS25 TaxID=3135776 RepID=UPI00398B6D9F
MTKTKKVFTVALLLALLLGAGSLLLLRSGDSPPLVQVSVPATVPSPNPKPLKVQKSFQLQPELSTNNSPVEEAETNAIQTVETEKTPEDLCELLPEWIREHGELFQDSRQINGQTVLRARGRYEWDDSGRMELEISDIGEMADEQLVKSLGFNHDLEETHTESGFTTTYDEPGYRMNQEYDSVEESGSIQLLVKNRYLVEIHIDNMPVEAFQDILDQDVPFEEIFSRTND